MVFNNLLVEITFDDSDPSICRVRTDERLSDERKGGSLGIVQVLLYKGNTQEKASTRGVSTK